MSSSDELRKEVEILLKTSCRLREEARRGQAKAKRLKRAINEQRRKKPVHSTERAAHATAPHPPPGFLPNP